MLPFLTYSAWDQKNTQAWLGRALVLFKFSLDLNNLDNKGKLIYSTHDGTENQFWKWRRQTGI